MPKTLSVLTIDPSKDSRDRLFDIIHNIEASSKLFQRDTLKNGLNFLTQYRKQDGIELVFLSSRFSESAVAQVIAEAKDTSAGEDSTYILIIDSENREKVKVAEGTLGGADGCVLEPYGVNHLLEVLKLSKKIRGQRQRAKEAAIAILVDESILCLDEISNAKLEGKGPGERLRYFRKLGRVLFALNETNLETYYQIALPKFSALEIPSFVIESANEAEDLPSVKEFMNSTDLEDQYLNQAISRLKDTLGAEGIDSDFLDEAVRRIRLRLISQGIEVDFTDETAAEASQEDGQEKSRKHLKKQFAKLGVQAEFLKDS